MQPSYAGPGPPVASQPYGTSGHFDPPPLPAAAAMDPGQAFPAGNHGGAAGPLAQPVYGPDLGAPAALNPAAWTDIGPFARPILNKLVRILSALTSLIALILHFAILGQ